MTTRRPSRVAGPAGLAVAALLFTGCASQTGTEDAASSASAPAASGSSSAPAEETTSSAAPTPEETAATSAFPGNTDADSADPVDPQGLSVTAVRAAAHDGFDRVVFEFSGSGTPGWSVDYVDTPTAQGSGDVVDVPGATYLAVDLQGVSYPYETGADEQPRGLVPVSGTDVVQGVFFDGTFEGVAVGYVGVSDRLPFRVYSLTGPSRVVVEVAHAG